MIKRRLSGMGNLGEALATGADAVASTNAGIITLAENAAPVDRMLAAAVNTRRATLANLAKLKHPGNTPVDVWEDAKLAFSTDVYDPTRDQYESDELFDSLPIAANGGVPTEWKPFQNRQQIDQFINNLDNNGLQAGEVFWVQAIKFYLLRASFTGTAASPVLTLSNADAMRNQNLVSLFAGLCDLGTITLTDGATDVWTNRRLAHMWDDMSGFNVESGAVAIESTATNVNFERGFGEFRNGPGRLMELNHPYIISSARQPKLTLRWPPGQTYSVDGVNCWVRIGLVGMRFKRGGLFAS